MGKDKTRRLRWVDLFSLVKQMGYKATTRDRKNILFGKLKEHMVKQMLWKASKEFKPSKRKANKHQKRTGQQVEGDRVRKRKAQELESDSSKVFKSSSRQSNRLSMST